MERAGFPEDGRPARGESVTIIESVMTEFFQQQPLYSVLLIVLICWAGILGYLVRLGRKISVMEKKGA
jgi:CcmD family protein